MRRFGTGRLAAVSLLVTACSDGGDTGEQTSSANNAAPATGNTLLMELKTGVVSIQLRPDLAPWHVEWIKTLAAQGFHDGIVPHHRVTDGFMAQTGDPTGTGRVRHACRCL